MTNSNPFARYDLDLLPPEPDERGAEEEEDYWDEVDRAYDEMRDRELEDRDCYSFHGVVDWTE